MKTKKLLVIATMAFMLSVALFAGLSSSAQAANAPAAAQTWYCDPGNVNKGIQFTLDNLAAPGDTICLYPQEGWQSSVYFYENVVVNYSVTILGLNHGRVAWEPRGSESYVYPAVDDSEAVFQIKADHVTIDGVFIGAAGRSGTTWITAEHGVIADASDIETDTIDNLTIINNFVESAVTGIELEGLFDVEGFYSFDNLISQNFVLSYFNAPQEAKDGIEMTSNFFADVINNKVKNIDDAIWVEWYSADEELLFSGNIIENTNVPLCHGIYIHEIFDEVDSLTIADTTITTFVDVIAPGASGTIYTGVGIGIYDVDAGVQVTIDGLEVENAFIGIQLDDVGTYIDIDESTPVVITDVEIEYAGLGLQVYNDDYYTSEVNLSNATFEDIYYDAIEVATEELPPAPGAPFGYMVVNLISNILVDGAGDAVEVLGPLSVVNSPAAAYSVVFADVEYYYFNLIENSFDIDATRIAFVYDGTPKLGSEMNWTEIFDVEYMMHHAIDDVELGFVMVVENTAYVIPSKTIQNAIEVFGDEGDYYHAFAAETVYVMWGSYTQIVEIWHSVKLEGVSNPWGPNLGQVPEILYGDATSGYSIEIDDASEVLVKNFHLRGPGCDEYESPADAIVVEADDAAVTDIALVDLYIENYYGNGTMFIGVGYAFSNIELENVYVNDMNAMAVYMQSTAFGVEDEDVLINRFITIDDCLFVDCLEDNEGNLAETYFATVVLFGIADTTIEESVFTETNEGSFNPYFWYLALLGTSGHNNFITGCVFDGVDEDAQNGVYVQTDAAGYYMATGIGFHAGTPVFTENLFMLNSGIVDPSPAAPLDEAYGLYYYEGDESNYDEDDFVAPEILSAAYNYWWSEMGPYSDGDHVYNPNADGTGPQVEDYIYFAPWYMHVDEDELIDLTADIFISLDKNLGRNFVDGDPTFMTIQAGVDAAEDGDWVIVNPGEYTETVDVNEDIFLLGGYELRGGYFEAMMYGDGVSTYMGFTYCLLVVECAATVDYFVFLGEEQNLVIYSGANGTVSSCDFSGSAIEDQVGLLIEYTSTVNVYNNEFWQIAMGEQQTWGSVAVFSESAADIHDCNFYGYNDGFNNATGVWAWSVYAPLAISDCEFYGLMFGINIEEYEFSTAMSSGIEISGNQIVGCLVGIAMDDVEETLISENTIVGAEELPYWFDFDYSFDVMIEDAGANVVVVHNNLLSMGNTDDTVGVWNSYPEEGYYPVNANDNYWGKQSGPAGASYYYDEAYYLYSLFGNNYANWLAWGGGSMVTYNVIIDTWLNMAYPNGQSISANWDAPIYMDGFDTMFGDEYFSNITNIEISVPYGAGSGEVVLGAYEGSPGKMFWGYNLGIYVEIAICHEDNNLNVLTVKIYFDEADLEGVNVDELRLFYWLPSEDMLGGVWMPCIGSTVDPEEQYVEMTFYAGEGPTFPSLDMLSNDMAFLIGAPKLVIDPEAGKSGITIHATATGFIAHDFVVAYIGDTLLGSVPTQLKGVYQVDEDGNISDISLILPYLNKGEYTIKVTDVEYAYYTIVDAPGIEVEDDISEYAASATYTVLGNSPLALSLDVGGMYFAGEVVNWVFSVTEEGTAYAVDPSMIFAQLVYAPTGEQVDVDSDAILQVDANTFVVTMTLSGEAPAGEYYLKVYVDDGSMYQGAEGKAFQVSETFGNMIYDLAGIQDGIMTIQSQLDTVQLSLDEIQATVVAIQDDVVYIKTTLGLVKTTVDQIDVNVIDVQNSLVDMRVQIATGFSNVQSTLSDLSAQVVAVQDGIVTLQTSVGVVQTTLNQVAANVMSIQDGVVTLQTSVGVVQTTLNAIGAEVSSINGTVVSIQTAVGQVQASLVDVNAKLVSLQGTTATISTNLNSVNATVNDIKVTVVRIEGNTVSMTTTLGNITGTLVSMSGTLATVNTNLGTVKTDVGNIAGATTGINSMLAFIILAILIVVAIVLIFLRTGKK